MSFEVMGTSMVPDRLLSIRQLSTKYDCSLRTLRFYEQLGFLNPQRSGLQRFYTLRDEVKLNLIICGKRLGLSLQEIRKLILERTGEACDGAEDVETVAPLLSRDKVDAQINLLSERIVQLDEAIAQLKEAQQRLPIVGDAIPA